jgi:hypothetical protein
MNGPGLDLGDVLGTTAKVVGKRFINLLVIAAICLAPSFVVGVLVALLGAGAQHMEPEQMEQLASNPGVLGGVVGGGLIVVVLSIVLGFVSQGAMLHTTIEHLAGREPTIGASLRVAMNKLMPILGASLLVGLVVMLGTLACVIPGIILQIMYYVAIPVVVAEGIHGTAAMQRSSELTQGNRWMIFATLIVFGLISLALVLVFTVVQTPFNLMAAEVPIIAIVPTFISFGQNVLQTMVGAVLVGVIYARLRGIRDGVDVQSLADVFA